VGADPVTEFLVAEGLVAAVDAAEARYAEDEEREMRNRQRVAAALADVKAGR
jgi:hypothetical protein